MSSTPDIIIGRQGDSLSGTVNDTQFVIATVFGNLTIPKGDIAQIHFKNPPQFAKDEIWTYAGDKHSGKIQSKFVDFTLHTGQRMQISNDLIHTIVMEGSFNRRAKKLAG